MLNGTFARFTAKVGIDNNPDTAGRGSAVIVRGEGRRQAGRADSASCMASDAPQSDRRANSTARSNWNSWSATAGTAFAYDQSDWGDAALTDAAGHKIYLSDAANTRVHGAVFFSQPSMLASFTYGGQPSSSLLPGWQRDVKPAEAKTDRTIYSVTWKEPGTGFSATWHATVFKDRQAMEFQWSFANDGSAPSKPLTEVAALDLHAQPPQGQFQVLSSSGGLDGSLTQGELGFELAEQANSNVTLNGRGGRSSDHSLPFFLVRSPQSNQGVYVGVGWSGEWRGDISESNNRDLSIRAGMPGMNLALPPGEHIIAPSILLGSFTGQASVGSNALRRDSLRPNMSRSSTAGSHFHPSPGTTGSSFRTRSPRTCSRSRPTTPPPRAWNISASIPAGSTAIFPTAWATGR